MVRFGIVLAILMLAVVTSGPALGAQPKPLSLSGRVVKQGDFAGVSPAAGSPASFSSARAWATWSPTFGYSNPTAAQLAQGLSALQRDGFVAAVSETLVTADNRGGYSFTVELGSPAGAQAEVTRLVGDWKANNGPNPASRFSVAGIPAVTAYRFGTNLNGSDHILFTDGRFAYHVGFHWAAGTKPARAALIAAAQKLYQRVHGHPAA
jgi:hypothetical protein